MSEFHTVYLALGSNLGDRALQIHAALKALAPFAAVRATSFLYETKAQYLADQPDYLNAVCRLTTTLTPHALLTALEATMQALGRVRTLQYGPRLIDLDILFYDDLVVATPELTIPHALLHERRFVLEPLCDLAPTLRHPILGQTVQELLAGVKQEVLVKVLPIGGRLWHWGQQTYLMGIINVTPDSFSGDGVLTVGDQLIERVTARAQRFVDEGADCLDIGGISTRPGHRLIPVIEEIARVVPVLQALRAAVEIPLSIDTFRGEVAQAALAAGATLLNDIWGLRFDSTLAHLAAAASVPLVVMHNRMQPVEEEYRAWVQRLPVGPSYEYVDLLGEIQAELTQSLDLAQALGMPRWLLIADPGMGFGKTVAQQLTLTHRLAELKRLGYPLLYAASRKSFIGKVLGGLPPEERLEGTLATGVIAIDRGVDILRVHDVRAMSRARRLADAIVR